MTARDRKHRTKCPFWSTTSMKCSICNGGIFIPLDDHVEAFCKTPHFSECIQYTLHPENQTSLQEKVRKSEDNRRKYIRIETSQRLTLVKIFESDKPESPFSTSASTLDVCQGGMRVTTKKALVNDMIVQFSFDKSFPHILHKVTGQVEWCNKQIDEPGYQAGVSFLENHVIEAMDRYLGNQKNTANTDKRV